jgi:hypothetical protein
VGLHLGYFIGSHFSLSGDLLYQRWLSHPTALNAINGAHAPLSDADMDTVTVAASPRLHFRLGKQAWIRPGISFVRGLDARGVVPESARTRNGRFSIYRASTILQILAILAGTLSSDGAWKPLKSLHFVSG